MPLILMQLSVSVWYDLKQKLKVSKLNFDLWISAWSCPLARTMNNASLSQNVIRAAVGSCLNGVTHGRTGFTVYCAAVIAGVCWFGFHLKSSSFGKFKNPSTLKVESASGWRKQTLSWETSRNTNTSSSESLLILIQCFWRHLTEIKSIMRSW